MARRKPPDWAVIEAEYLAGGVSYQQLADKHGVSKRTVERRGTAGDWPSRCRQLVGAVSAELPAVIARSRLEQAVDEAIMGRDEVLRRLTAIARGGMHRVATWGPDGVILRDSTELEEEARALVSEVGETVNAFGKAVRVKVLDPVAALKELARHHGIAVDPKAGGLNGGNAGAPPATDEPRRELGTAELDERIAAAIARSRGGGA